MRHLLLVLSFSVTPLSAHEKATDPWQQYHNIAQTTVNHVNKIPLPQIQKAGKNLVNVSKTLLTSFVSSNPQCNTYLNTALAAADKMQTLSLAQIEADYHEDGKLPALSDPSCYHAKDLLVHAATVVVLSKTLPDSEKIRKKIAHELEEVLEHLSQVKAAV